MPGSNFKLADLDAGSQTRIKDCFFKRYGTAESLADANAVTDSVMDTIIDKYFVQATVDSVEVDDLRDNPNALT